MLRDIRKSRIFNRRAVLLGAGQTGLAGILLLRLGYLQFWKHQEYSNQAESNRVKPIVNPAPRGIIYDRYGFPLARNDSNYRLLLYLDRKRNYQQLIDKLSEILQFGEEMRQILLSRIKNSRRKKIIALIDNLEWGDLSRIETNSHLLSGLSIESGIIRSYPYPYETAHFVGYVSLPSEKEIDDNEPHLFMHPDFRIGKFGIEKSFDEHLRGQYGVKYVEVNAHEVPLKTLSIKEPVEGGKVNLTIDFKLQKFTYNRIKDLVASVVVIDVKTGEILAYASSPSFDSNNFVEGVSSKYWQELNNDPKKPLNNKPISALYPPGSTFKLMVALAALENGFNPNNRFYCKGSYALGKRVFHCWKEEGHGSQDLIDGIMNSCNVYFFNVASQIGYEKIMEMAKRFGYGEKPDISLFGARSGLVPSEEWKQKVFKQPWVKGDTLNVSIGQGSVLATPLQMALITARIANGGIPINPYLVRTNAVEKQFDELKSKKLVDADHLKMVCEGMFRVVNEPGGTAYGKKIDFPGYEMAGKTGTSQIISKREKEMTDEENEKNANHAIFVGFAPFKDPRFAVSVVVEHGKSGSMAAAPIARDVLMEAQGIYVQPDLT